MIFERSKYPDLPGVYLMMDNSLHVIYIGKASSLRSRLSQYFHDTSSVKTTSLVSNINSIDFVVTKDSNEALVLESNLIKNYQPKYNMLLKDAKHYAYLALTKEKFPRLLIARKNSSGKFRLKDAKFFGPYTQGSKRELSARYLRKLFKIRICSKLPKKECLQYHLGNCDAPCISAVNEDDYNKNVQALYSVLEGKNQAKELISSLSKRMLDASKNQNYEKAASLRDQLTSLDIFFGRQRVEKIRKDDEDYVWFQAVGTTLYVQILKSRAGVIGNVEKHSVAINEQEDPELSFMLQYYHEFPDRVYSNLHPADIDRLNSSLTLNLFYEPNTEQKKLLEIAAKSLIYGTIDNAVLQLKEELKLPNSPVVIETFDISTLFGENSVASMVQFVNGKPSKSNYRKFKIKTVKGQDDFSMMKEVVLRRYSRLISEESPMPDLVLIDGGVGQLHAAMDAMDEAGVRLPIISIAKKEEELYLPNKMTPLRLSRSNPALKLLQRCRDEAHRFALVYHRKRRSKL